MFSLKVNAPHGASDFCVFDTALIERLKSSDPSSPGERGSPPDLALSFGISIS